MTDRQCSSCGGFCKRSGCERENVKPQPVRLADDLDSEFATGRISNQTGREAAAELRRLHELESMVSAMGNVNRSLIDDVARLHSVNAQLLEALVAAVTYFDEPGDGCFSDTQLAQARAAIAAAKGEA
jgi:hypothetical protein